MTLSNEQIWQAADELASEGVKPTIQAVRDRLGYGSYETIVPAMAQWRARQDVDRSVTVPIPKDLKAKGELHVNQLWNAAMETADASMHAEREGLRAAQAELAHEQQELGRVADTLNIKLVESQNGIETLKAQNAAIETELTAARSQAAALEARFQEAERFRSEERAERQALQAELDSARSALAAVQNQKRA